jgi:hypothetical protein
MLYCYWFVPVLSITLLCNSSISDQAYLKRIRNFSVLNPTKLLDTSALDTAKAKRVMNFWTAGPVHMTDRL